MLTMLNIVLQFAQRLLVTQFSPTVMVIAWGHFTESSLGDLEEGGGLQG